VGGAGRRGGGRGVGRIILGDLNAELPDALGREGRQPRLADELLRELCEEEHFITAGPDQATYTHGGMCREGQRDQSQIDHILCDASVAPTLGESEVLPGLSSEDHWMLQAGLLRQVGTQAGPQRCGKLPLWELDAGRPSSVCRPPAPGRPVFTKSGPIPPSLYQGWGNGLALWGPGVRVRGQGSGVRVRVRESGSLYSYILDIRAALP